MGCSSSRDLTLPKTPLEVIVYEEARKGQLQRIKKKEEEHFENLRKKLERKRKKHLKKSRKNSRRSTSSSRRRITNAKRAQRNEASKFIDLDAEIEEETQALLNTDLCMFLLNQTALSLEFFENFESESTSILAEFLNKENDFNKNLEDQSILLGNPLDAVVQKWIKFKPIHGPDKYQSQLLQAPVMYVVFENIDISRPDDSNYDSIPPLCNVIMETKSYRTTPCKEELIEILREIQWKGYVRLKLPENPKKSDENAEDREKFKIAKENRNGIYSTSLMGQSSSGYGTEPDYDYAFITKLNTQKPLAELKMDGSQKIRQSSAQVLPDACISYLGDYLETKHLPDSDDDMYEFNEEGNYNLDVDVEKRIKPFRNMEALQAIRRYKQEEGRRRKLLQQRYINSQRFMAYFAELMRQNLAKKLLVNDKDFANATYRGASIYTKDYEIIPAIHVAQNAQHWPECTAQFRLRERPVRIHPRSGEKIQWPTRAMIKQIETFGYHVIPMGYAPKRRKNPFRELEWRIVFPKAERYLERHLSYTQVKIFMIMKALIKTFIEPKEPGKRLLFVLELLRTHLFWECERNFTIWPEEFLGDVLLRFIDTFKLSLKQKRLRDYFIQERNLLDGIPEQSIMTLVSILADIASNPLMHVLVALRNLGFNEKFFPKLDFRKIFKNLIAENLSKLKQLSKNSNYFADTEHGSDGDEHDFELVDEDPDGLIGSAQHEEIAPEKFSKRACQLLYEMEKVKREKKRRRGSVESVQVEFFYNSNLPEHGINESINVGLEFLRRSNLLEILMDHFLAALRKSIKFRNLKVSRSLLMQLHRFVKYYQCYGSDLIANDYENSIQLLEDALQELYSSYGTLELETFDNDVPEIYSNEKNLKDKAQPLTDARPYEEVISMTEDLPTIHKALKIWDSKLQTKHSSSLRSSKSTRGSKRSINVKTIQVEIHNTKKKAQRHRDTKEKKVKTAASNCSQGKTFKESSTNLSESQGKNGIINLNKSLKSGEGNEFILRAHKFSKIPSSPLADWSNKNSLQQNLKQNSIKKSSSLENISDQMVMSCKSGNKLFVEDLSTAYETNSNASCPKIQNSTHEGLEETTNLSDSDSSENTRCSKSKDDKKSEKTNKNKKSEIKRNKCNKVEEKINPSVYTAQEFEFTMKHPTKLLENKKEFQNPKEIKTRTIFNKHKHKAKTRRKSKGICDIDSEESGGNLGRRRFSEHTFSKNQKKMPTKLVNEAYDNEAYSRESIEQIHESINLSLKIKETNAKALQSQRINKKHLNSSVKNASTKDGSFSDSSKSSTLGNIKIKRNTDSFLSQSSKRSQVTSKQNRRITYETDTDEEVTSLPQSSSQEVVEHFEFKCLEDLSIDPSQEFEATESDKPCIDPTDLFAYKVVNEKLLKSSKESCPIYSKDQESCNQTSLSKQFNRKESKQILDCDNWHDIGLKVMSEDSTVEDDHETENKTDSKDGTTTKKSFFNKYINRDNILKKIFIISPDMIDTLAESKKKIKSSLNEEKCAHVRSVLKKRTFEFKKAYLK